MPRQARFAQETLVEAALPAFWRHGFAATPVAALTHPGKGSRQAIYGAFCDKRALFAACLAAYRATVVDAAFARVEAPGAGLADIAAYFEQQIGAAERVGLPGPGCLYANTLIELAPHDPAIGQQVTAHLERLTAGFAQALSQAGAGRPQAEIDSWAALLTVFAQGLWSVSRVTTEGEAMRAPVRGLLRLIEGALAR